MWPKHRVGSTSTDKADSRAVLLLYCACVEKLPYWPGPSAEMCRGGHLSAPRMTGRRSHWTERGDDNIFFTFGHCSALVNPRYPSPESLGRK